MKFWTTHSVKKVSIWLLTSLSAVFLLVYLSRYLYNYHLDSHFICGYPKYKFIQKSLTKNEVTNILGLPSKTKVKSTMDEYIFGQGEMESEIKEGWFYYKFFGWSGGIEVYFDENGIVVGKNCGY